MGWFGKDDKSDDLIEVEAEPIDAFEVVEEPPSAIPAAHTGALSSSRMPQAMGVKVQGFDAPIVTGERTKTPIEPPIETPSAVPQRAYGIDQVVSLMRELPQTNVEVVVRVLKKTLESVDISVPSLIEDATHRESSLQGRIGALRSEIAGLEEQIALRNAEIKTLDDQYEEVARTKERLSLSEKLVAGDSTRPAPTAPPSPSLARRPPPPPPPLSDASRPPIVRQSGAGGSLSTHPRIPTAGLTSKPE